MELKVLDAAFTVCRLPADAFEIPDGEYCFRSRTDEELSLVCPTQLSPGMVLAREDGWRAFRIQGVLDFSLIGILARISGLLAERRIGLFVISTYNTDYVLVKQAQLEEALQTLSQNGYQIV